MTLTSLYTYQYIKLLLLNVALGKQNTRKLKKKTHKYRHLHKTRPETNSNGMIGGKGREQSDWEKRCFVVSQDTVFVFWVGKKDWGGERRAYGHILSSLTSLPSLNDKDMSGRKKFYSTLQVSFGWSKNYIGMKEFNRRKLNLATYILVLHKNLRLTGSQALKLICCPPE